jgi:GNAT superfamily N-acetyltransferase
MTIRVRRVELGDLSYVDAVRRRDSEALGFMSMAKYEAIVTGQGPHARPSNRLWIAQVDGERVGFLYLTPGQPGGSAKIIQVAVQRDARRQEYATALVAVAERYAAQTQRGGVSLGVGEDLEAARFWDALGYQLRFRYQGGDRRKRILERRYKTLPCGLLVAA